MGRNAKLRQQRKTTTDWTKHDRASFAKFIEERDRAGYKEVVLVLENEYSFQHLAKLTQGQRYSLPVHIHKVY